MVILAIAAWVLAGLIALLGINAGQTIWFHMEPVVDSVPEPASYFFAASVGFLALCLSFAISVGLTVLATRSRASRNSETH